MFVLVEHRSNTPIAVGSEIDSLVRHAEELGRKVIQDNDLRLSGSSDELCIVEVPVVHAE